MNDYDYIVLLAEHPHRWKASEELSQKVKEQIKKGWELVGGIDVTTYKIMSTVYYIFSQAMIKVQIKEK